MVEFKLTPHSSRWVAVIEVWVDGKFRATITPTEKGFRVLSSYFASIEVGYTPGDPPLPALMEFAFTGLDQATEPAFAIREA